MGKKFFYILTVLMFSISAASADEPTKTLFPMDGGTTSDGIIISMPTIDGFQIMAKDNKINAEKLRKKASMTFTITVPDGKVASIDFKLLLTLAKTENVPIGKTQMFFSVRVDDQQVISHQTEKGKFNYNLQKFTVPSGPHKVSIEAQFTASKNEDKVSMKGGFQNMYVHVHHFTEPVLLCEAICGQTGKTTTQCVVCGLSNEVNIAPKYEDHLLIKNAQTKNSCLSNLGSLTTCERCPYTVIERVDTIKSHDFDNNGTCRVCKMHKPKSNATHSVYEIYSASEMRILAEMVSIGAIPGNIGVDIKSDLVFNNDTTMLPIGTFEHPFQGVLNGNGHHIRGITNCFQGIDCLGFVGVAQGTPLSHAVIANLIFDTGNIMKGTACVGGIVGYATYCDIVNCASFGTLEGNNYVGSIVGYADKQVSFRNCASVSRIRTEGYWNPMACGLPFGHILNSYGAATNSLGGQPDEMATTKFRHCFTTEGSTDGLTQVSRETMMSYDMVQLLNEESESPCFVMSQNDAYPIPVVNTTIQAQPNGDIPTTWTAIPRRVPVADITDTDGESEGKGLEVEVIGGYYNEAAMDELGSTVEECISKDSLEYADFSRTYIISYRVTDEEFELFEPMSGGELMNFESYMLSPDSTYLKLTEYNLGMSGKLKARTETIDDWSGADVRIDEYTITDDSRKLKSRTIIEKDDDIIYMENIDGILRKVWYLKTTYDEEGNPISNDLYSYNYKTGESNLEYSVQYSNGGSGSGTETASYEEYIDKQTNTIHILFNNVDTISGAVISREHLIISVDDELLREIRSEKMINGEPFLTDGMYFVYNDENILVQSVAYGPKDENDPGFNLRPYLYHEYIGLNAPNPYPTAIKVPTMEVPSLQKHTDYNVYDMQGRVVRRVKDVHDPFSGLPNGLYIYQGEKYLKR